MDGELMPLSMILAHAAAIARDKKVVIHCQTGGRSIQAIRLLKEKFGFEHLYNLKGGMVAYLDEVKK